MQFFHLPVSSLKAWTPLDDNIGPVLFLKIQKQQQDECLKKDGQLIEAGTEKIREAQEHGDIRADVNPAFILFTMIGIVQHWFQDHAHILEHLDPNLDRDAVDTAYLNDVLKIFFEGILPR